MFPLLLSLTALASPLPEEDLDDLRSVTNICLHGSVGERRSDIKLVFDHGTLVSVDWGTTDFEKYTARCLDREAKRSYRFDDSLDGTFEVTGHPMSPLAQLRDAMPEPVNPDHIDQFNRCAEANLPEGNLVLTLGVRAMFGGRGQISVDVFGAPLTADQDMALYKCAGLATREWTLPEWWLGGAYVSFTRPGPDTTPAALRALADKSLSDDICPKKDIAPVEFSHEGHEFAAANVCLDDLPFATLTAKREACQVLRGDTPAPHPKEHRSWADDTTIYRYNQLSRNKCSLTMAPIPPPNTWTRGIPASILWW